MAVSTLGLPRGLPSDSLLDLNPEMESGEVGITGQAVTVANSNARVRWANREMTKAEPHVMAWREQADEAYRFRDGHQLSDEDLRILKTQRRPDTAINEVQKFIKFASGIERRTPCALIFASRTVDDQEAATKGELCLIGDTRVRSGRIRRSFERLYQGPIVNLKFANGQSLSGTPNHPILTVSGWKPLGAIKEGDYLVDARLFDLLGLNNYFDHAEARIEDRARSFKTGDAALRVATVPDDFHGDGAYSDVHVVRTDSALGNPGIAPIAKSAINEIVSHSRLGLAAGLIDRALLRVVDWTGRFAVRERKQFGLTTSAQLIARIAKLIVNQPVAYATAGGDFVGGQPLFVEPPNTASGEALTAASPLLIPRASAAAHRVARLLETVLYGGTIQSDQRADLRRRELVAEIESGQIVRRDRGAVLPAVRVTEATCVHQTIPVFNLETSEGFYTANGIIAHNCTKFAEWFVDRSAGTYERSAAFEDKLVGGLGWVDIGITRASNPQGDPRYRRTPPEQMWWPETDAMNFGLDQPGGGPRWLARESFMDVDEAIRKWPDEGMFIRAAAGGAANEDQIPDFGRGAGRPINYVVPWIMTEPLNKNGGGSSGKPGKVPITEFQFYDTEDGYYFFDPLEQNDTWLNEADFRKYRSRLKALYHQAITDFDQQDKRVYKRMFMLQRRILLGDETKLVTQSGGFTWNVMTGTWDRKDKVFYGLLRALMAPQRYANAMFRQVLEIMGASTKGGYLAETGAITLAQKRDIEETGARAGSVNIVQAGAIQGNRILPKAIPQMPQGSLAVLSFCIDMMEKIIGLSTSLLGTDQSNTPGVSLRRRLTQGMVLLAAEFDSLSRFRKREGALIFDFMKLIADNRVIRIGGAFDGQAIRMTKDPFAIDYDIVLDENDQDPNLRQFYTDSILQIAPMLVRTGNFFPELLDYVNLPVQIRQKLKEGMASSEKQKAEMAQEGLAAGGRGKPRGKQDVESDNLLKTARSVEHFAKAKAVITNSANSRSASERDDLAAIFDRLLAAHKEDRENRHGDAKVSLEALGKMFEGIKAAQGLGNG